MLKKKKKKKKKKTKKKKTRNNKSLKRDISCFIFHFVFLGEFSVRYLAKKKSKQ